jgi:hypothetical protein
MYISVASTFVCWILQSTQLPPSLSASLSGLHKFPINQAKIKRKYLNNIRVRFNIYLVIFAFVNNILHVFAPDS